MIKFRVWDKNCYDYDWHDPSYDDVYGTDLNEIFENKEVEFEQFTGLKDANGKDIYEGDILRTKAGLIQIVRQGLLVIDREDLISGFYADNVIDRNPHTFSYDDEVIGNVHDNPGLLEEDK